MSVERHKLQVERHVRRAVSSRLGSRSAITLTEVLISMGILTLGLLGVAALFPVGGFYMQKAEISDRGSAIAQQAMNDLVARGYLSPKHWIMHDVVSDTFAPQMSYAATVAQSLPSLNSANVATKTYANKLIGSAVVLDPNGVAGYLASSDVASLGSTPNWVCNFPAKSWYYYGSKSPSQYWSPWKGSSLRGHGPIRRVTLGDANGVMRPEIAEVLFGGSDDLASDMPERDDRPSVQTWDTANIGGNQLPLGRQWTGDYSWLATIVPTSYEARNALGRNPGQFDYDVSVVVFYKRVLGAIGQGASTAAQFNYSPAEVLVPAAVKSTGISGGELLLTSEASAQKSFEGLKVGQWIMLFGPRPDSSPSPQSNAFRPSLFLSWYQVMAIDEDMLSVDRVANREQRYVTLRGPKWPWLPASNTQASDLSNDLCVGIFPGAVAVHTKTMQLESLNGNAWNLAGGPSGSGGPAGPGGPSGSAGGGPVVPPPWWYP